MTPEIRALGQTPEARKKAGATLRKTLAEKKKKAAEAGTHSVINVADLALPERKKPKVRKGRRRAFTPAEKLGYVQRIEAALAKDGDLKDVLAKEDIHRSQFYQWQRTKKKLAKLAAKGAELRALANGKKLNGAAHPTGNYIVASRYDPISHNMKVNLTINGQEHLVTTEEALVLRAGLAALGF